MRSSSESDSMIHEMGVIVPGQAELEISHSLRSARFAEVGATIINLVNREYCKKLIVMLPGQKHPEHCHKLKEEPSSCCMATSRSTLPVSGRKRAGDLLVVERGVAHSFSSHGGMIMEEISSTHHKGDSYYTDPAILPADERKTLISYWLGDKRRLPYDGCEAIIPC